MAEIIVSLIFKEIDFLDLMISFFPFTLMKKQIIPDTFFLFVVEMKVNERERQRLIASCCYIVAEFLVKCAEMYKTLLSVARTPHDPVVVPTSEETPTENHQPLPGTNNPEVGHGGQDGVDSAQFLRALSPIAEKMVPG